MNLATFKETVQSQEGRNADPSNQSIFIAIPGTHSRNVYFWYRDNYESVMERPATPISLYDNKDDYFTWSIVRNPYDRTLGGYHQYGVYLRQWAMYNAAAKFELKVWNSGFDAWLYQFGQHASFAIDPDDRRDQETWNGLRYLTSTTQAQWLSPDYTKPLKPSVDQVIRYEDLDRDFKIIQDRLGITDDLKEIDVYEPLIDTMGSPMSKRSKAIIEEMHAADFELFGY